MTASAPQIGYFDLPGEVRNQIMDLVLKPGDIHFSRSSTQDTQAPPGIQLLASNRQAYTEGCGIFYSENTFHIPPGPIICTERAFDPYQPQHLALIRRVTLHVGLHDLGYVGDLKQFEKRIDESNTSPEYNDMISCLVEIWRRKLLYVRERFHNLEELRIVFWDLNYDLWTKEEARKVNFIQPSHVLRDNETLGTGPYGVAAPERVVTFVYKGEDIMTALRYLPISGGGEYYLHMSGDDEVSRERAYGELPCTLLEAAFKTQDELLVWEVIELSFDLKERVADLAARHALRIRR